MTLRLIRALLLNSLLGSSALAYSMFERASSTETAGSFAESMITSALDTLSSPTFVAYILTVTWLIYSLVDTRVTRQLPRLIRTGSYFGLLLDITIRSSKVLLIPACSVIFAAALAPFLTRPSSAEVANFGAAHLLESIGLVPVVALILQIVLMFMFFVTIRLCVEMFLLILNFAAAIGLCIGIWIWAAASASGFIALGSLADFRSYVFLAAYVGHPELPPETIATYFAFILALALSAVVLDISARDRLPKISALFLSCASAFLIVLAAIAAQRGGEASLFSTTIVIFLGANGTILQMLLAVILLVGYTFFCQFRIANELGPWGLQTLLRHGSRYKQLLSIARIELLRVAIYCMALLASVIIGYAMVGGRTFSFPAEGSVLLIYQLTIVQTLQVFFYISCVVAANVLFESELAGLAVVGILAALSTMPILPTLHIPIQLSAAGLLYEGSWVTALTNSLVLLISIALVLGTTLLPPKATFFGHNYAIKLGAKS